jgi:hypothetical protein
MLTSVRIVSLSVGVLAVSLAAPMTQAADPAALQRAPAPGVLNAEHLTVGQFKALPDSTVIEVRGTRTTAGALRAKAQQQAAEAEAKRKAGAAQAQAKFEAYRANFLKEQQAKADAANAVIRQAFAHLHGAQSTAPALTAQHQAIQQEAIQLLHRAKTASPAEQVHIERRAGELLQQLHQLQQSPPPH